ncbi:hypothetical protein BDN70DRAFT_563270 [Pholiota conissans]|uniref:Uncharacterized protein n=1 Tax=Pholiota conissans TaxID=109636 RepID=A0A9P5YPE9_9AGAR|nr:hypothetical protein BDN70DRAFT_563270 [Pholiota conissans]
MTERVTLEDESSIPDVRTWKVPQRNTNVSLLLFRHFVVCRRLSVVHGEWVGMYSQNVNIERDGYVPWRFQHTQYACETRTRSGTRGIGGRLRLEDVCRWRGLVWRAGCDE